MRFEKGECYFAVPCLEGAKKMMVTAIARRGKVVIFSAATPLETEWVDTFDGREVARIKGGDGLNYTVSPASHIDSELVHDVADALRPPAKVLRKVARRGIFSKLGVPLC